MKKILLLLAILGSLSFGYEITEKNWWQQDKQKHFLYSTGIAGVSTAIARSYGSNKFEAFWIGFGSSLAIGVIKEYTDGRNPLFHTEDTKDIYADMLGSTTGALISTQFTWRF